MKHPFVTVTCALLLIFVVQSNVEGQRAQAYAASPEGRLQAAKAEADSEREAAFHVAKLMVGMRLRDPDSAKFEGLRLVKVDGHKAVCGLVNSRNGFGGMSGPTLFVQDDDGEYILGDRPEAVTKIGHYCAGRASRI